MSSNLIDKLIQIKKFNQIVFLFFPNKKLNIKASVAIQSGPM